MKQCLSDFVVEEVAAPPLSSSGDHTLLLVNKTNINTLDAVREIAAQLGIRRNDVAFAGLKDKYAVASQFFSVPIRVTDRIMGRGFTAEPAGTLSQPISSVHLQANRFSITLRDLSKADVREVRESFTLACKWGVPNYFDLQRFGSARHGKGFPAKFLIKGDYETALRIVLTATSRMDTRRIKEFRRMIDRMWGNWKECNDALPPSDQRKIISHLVEHPFDFRGAIQKLNHRLLSLMVFSYQSYIWNRSLVRFLERTPGIENTFVYEHPFGSFLFYERLHPELLEKLKNEFLPLASRGVTFDDPLKKEVTESVLAEEGLTLQEFYIRKVRKVFLSSIPRKVVVIPQETNPPETGKDEANQGKRFLRLSFSLPPGSYATVVIKRIWPRRGKKTVHGRERTGRHF